MNNEPPNVLFCMYFVCVFRIQRLESCLLKAVEKYRNFEQEDSEIRNLAVSHPSVQSKRMKKLEQYRRKCTKYETCYVFLTRKKNELKTDVCNFNSFGFEKRKEVLRKWKETVLKDCASRCSYCFKLIVRKKDISPFGEFELKEKKEKFFCEGCSPLTQYCCEKHRKLDRENHTYYVCSIYFGPVSRFELTLKFQSLEDERMSFVDGRKRLEAMFEETEKRNEKINRIYQELENDSAQSLGTDLKKWMVEKRKIELRNKGLQDLQSSHRRMSEFLESKLEKKNLLLKLIKQENEKKRKEKIRKLKYQKRDSAPVGPNEDEVDSDENVLQEKDENGVFSVKLDSFLKNDVSVLLGRLFETLKHNEKAISKQEGLIKEHKTRMKRDNAEILDLKRKLAKTENDKKSLELKLSAFSKPTSFDISTQTQKKIKKLSFHYEKELRND